MAGEDGGDFGDAEGAKLISVGRCGRVWRAGRGEGDEVGGSGVVAHGGERGSGVVEDSEGVGGDEEPEGGVEGAGEVEVSVGVGEG